MIATAAEKNPSCFRPGPLADAEADLAPTYISLVSLLFVLSTPTGLREMAVFRRNLLISG